MEALNPVNLVRYRKSLARLLPKPRAWSPVLWVTGFSEKDVRIIASRLREGVDQDNKLALAVDETVDDLLDEFHINFPKLPTDIYTLLDDLGYDLEP